MMISVADTTKTWAWPIPFLYDEEMPFHTSVMTVR